MTAYGAVISLKNTIHYILHSSHFTLVEPSPTIILLAYNQLQPWQKILARLDETRTSRSRKKVNVVDGRIKDVLWELEDKLESLLYQQILPQFPVDGGMEELLFSIDLHCLEDDVASFIQALEDLKMDYIYELENMAEDDGEESTSLIVGFGGTNSKMIGLSDQFKDARRALLGRNLRASVYGLVGMAGIGKTTLAMEIFHDPEISRHFDCRAWVTVGRKSRLNEVARDVLAQLCGATLVEGDEEIGYHLGHRLQGKRCLIVLDDVWETQLLDSLIPYMICGGQNQFLVTSRERKVVSNVSFVLSMCYTVVVRFLNEEESKELLCEKVFGGKDLCPPQLDKAATKIAKKCEGLPLMIVTVADILSKSQNTEPDYWNDVAKQRNSVFKDAYNAISKVLFPSYDYLPQYLKMPFLFMGVFPSDCDTTPSKIINMLTAEGWFIDTNRNQSLEDSVRHCFDELCFYRNHVLFSKKSISWHRRNDRGMLKTCRLHSTWRHLCRGEARKNMFYHVLNRLVDAEEGGKGQRGLCLENNILFGIKDFCNSVRLHCASSTRSLLFFGPYHQYPVPIDVGFKLLTKLDALRQRFYSFPIEILSLVQLKYLALTCNGELPTAISKLFNLRVLIFHPHMKIRRCRAPSYVPVQIWDMQKLEHIEILGKSLVAPSHVASLENLSTLVGMNASICTMLELFKKLPCIRKLGVQIELTPYDDYDDLLSCFCCFSTLGSLDILKCSIINPVLKYGCDFPATPRSLMLPRGLRKLHLSGMGFPWEYMDVIGSLPLLQVLKLRSYAFRGSNWEVQEDSFMSLEFLLIEDSDLVQWKPTSRSFRLLSYLSMRYCYKLEEIHYPYDFIELKIELVDCNPLALTCAKQLHLSSNYIDLTTFSSYEEKPVTIELRRSRTDDQYDIPFIDPLMSNRKPNWY